MIVLLKGSYLNDRHEDRDVKGQVTVEQTRPETSVKIDFMGYLHQHNPGDHISIKLVEAIAKAEMARQKVLKTKWAWLRGFEVYKWRYVFQTVTGSLWAAFLDEKGESWLMYDGPVARFCMHQVGWQPELRVVDEAIVLTGEATEIPENLGGLGSLIEVHRVSSAEQWGVSWEPEELEQVGFSGE